MNTDHKEVLQMENRFDPFDLALSSVIHFLNRVFSGILPEWGNVSASYIKWKLLKDGVERKVEVTSTQWQEGSLLTVRFDNCNGEWQAFDARLDLGISELSSSFCLNCTGPTFTIDPTRDDSRVSAAIEAHNKSSDAKSDRGKSHE